MPPRQPSCLISGRGCRSRASAATPSTPSRSPIAPAKDRKSTRLNSSHLVISYAVFCLKKKKTLPRHTSILMLMHDKSITQQRILLNVKLLVMSHRIKLQSHTVAPDVQHIDMILSTAVI